MRIDALDALAEDDVRPVLASCCGATAWVEAMIVRRPFRTHAGLFTAAEQAWRALDSDDWHEAFSHHPRIGETRSVAATSVRAQRWSEGEQRESGTGATAVQDALRDGQRAYEQRFGWPFITCASGRTASAIVGELRARMENDPGAEIVIAAEEQRRITWLRLEKLVSAEAESLS